jgi:hypothetical protein
MEIVFFFEVNQYLDIYFRSLYIMPKNGGVAQVVEQAAHIRWVRGSSPFAAIFFEYGVSPALRPLNPPKFIYPKLIYPE